MTINGHKVDTYRTNTSGWFFNRTTYRIFTYTVTEVTTGYYSYESYAFNVDDAQSETSRTVMLTVNKSGGGWYGGWWW